MSNLQNLETEEKIYQEVVDDNSSEMQLKIEALKIAFNCDRDAAIDMIAEATIQSIQVTSSTGKYPHLKRSMSGSGMFGPRRTMINRVRIQNAMDAIATRLNTNPPSSNSTDSINNGTC